MGLEQWCWLGCPVKNIILRLCSYLLRSGAKFSPNIAPLVKRYKQNFQDTLVLAVRVQQKAFQHPSLARLLLLGKKSDEKKFNSKMYSARWQFNVAMPNSTQTLFALKFSPPFALSIHSSNIKNSNNSRYSWISATMQAPKCYESSL